MGLVGHPHREWLGQVASLWQVTRLLNHKPSVEISGKEVLGQCQAQASASKLGKEAVAMVWLREHQRDPWQKEGQSLAWTALWE